MLFHIGTGQLNPIDANICMNDVVPRTCRRSWDRGICNLEHRTNLPAKACRVKVERFFALAVVVNVE